MAYMRGKLYVWSDAESLHIWSTDGAEDISEMEWSSGAPAAAGISLPHAQVDALALMLVAELVRTGKLASAVEYTLREHGQNFGAVALREVGTQLVAVCKPLAVAAPGA